MSKSQIIKKLEQLEKLLNHIDEVHVINSDEPDTWDSDALYNLAENCKVVLKLLEDKLSPKEKDEFGEPLILEKGLLSLVDEWNENHDE